MLPWIYNVSLLISSDFIWQMTLLQYFIFKFIFRVMLKKCFMLISFWKWFIWLFVWFDDGDIASAWKRFIWLQDEHSSVHRRLVSITINFMLKNRIPPYNNYKLTMHLWKVFIRPINLSTLTTQASFNWLYCSFPLPDIFFFTIKT